MTRRNLCFAFACLLILIVFSDSLLALVRLSLQADSYSHILLIPGISAVLIYLERRKIFSSLGSNPGIAVILLLGGFILYLLAGLQSQTFGGAESLAIVVSSMVILIMAAFTLCYGRHALQGARFSLLFLSLMIPIPELLLDNVILLLQQGSAYVTHVFFVLAGVPVYREGMVFSLPGIDIEVAKECSGIRSSQALLITCLLAGHLFLGSVWSKASLLLLAVPILVLKNGLRIATLSLLGIYVDPSFLTGTLHRQGGILFFLWAIALLLPILLFLWRSEIKQGRES